MGGRSRYGTTAVLMPFRFVKRDVGVGERAAVLLLVVVLRLAHAAAKIGRKSTSPVPKARGEPPRLLVGLGLNGADVLMPSLMCSILTRVGYVLMKRRR